MSYRCNLCDTPVPAGRSELRHLVLRDDGSIERELRVCSTCSLVLASGVEPRNVLRFYKISQPEPAHTAPARGGKFVGEED